MKKNMTRIRKRKNRSNLKIREAVAWILVVILFFSNDPFDIQSIFSADEDLESYQIFRTKDGRERSFYGGSPVGRPFRGSCWCSQNEYCMCTPSLAIDTILIEEGM